MGFWNFYNTHFFPLKVECLKKVFQMLFNTLFWTYNDIEDIIVFFDLSIDPFHRPIDWLFPHIDIKHLDDNWKSKCLISKDETMWSFNHMLSIIIDAKKLDGIKTASSSTFLMFLPIFIFTTPFELPYPHLNLKSLLTSPPAHNPHLKTLEPNLVFLPILVQF